MQRFESLQSFNQMTGKYESMPLPTLKLPATSRQILPLLLLHNTCQKQAGRPFSSLLPPKKTWFLRDHPFFNFTLCFISSNSFMTLASFRPAALPASLLSQKTWFLKDNPFFYFTLCFISFISFMTLTAASYRPAALPASLLSPKT
jgi:hypothetical protein